MVDHRLGRGGFAGRNQAEMARRQGQRRVGGECSEHGESGQVPSNRSGQQQAMARAGDPVEDHAGERRRRPVRGKAAQQGGDGSPLPPRIDDQHHRPAGELRQFGGRARFAVGAGAVEQTHDPFAQHDLGGGFQRRGARGQGLGPHRPRVEIDARPAARHGMKGRVDEIGAGLGRRDPQPAPAQMAQQAGSDEGLAAARSRGGEDQPARLHRAADNGCRG